MVIRKKAPEAWRTLLRTVPSLRSCSDQELAEVARLVEDVTVPEGATLIREGDRASEAFVIVDGWAAVTVHGEPVAAVGPGDYVGEVAMLDRQPRTATVVAKTPMRLLVVGPQCFGAFAHQPAVGIGMASGLARRVRRADEALAHEFRRS